MKNHLFYAAILFSKKNEFRIGSVDIGLENIAVAIVRVADLPSQCSNIAEG